MLFAINTLADKIYCIHLLLRGLMNAGGYWEEVNSTCEQLECLYSKLIETQPFLDELKTLRITDSIFCYSPYQDCPQYFSKIHNQIAIMFKIIFKILLKIK